MHNLKMDCSLNMAVVIFLLQHQFDHEEIYCPAMDVSTVLGGARSMGRWRQGKPKQT